MQKLSYIISLLLFCHHSYAASSKTGTLPFTPSSEQVRLGEKHKDDWVRILIQPNGWGKTPQAAIKDLERVMRIYEEKPGFICYPYKKVIRFSKYLYQCDGQCSYYAKRGLRSRQVKRGARNYTSLKK